VRGAIVIAGRRHRDRRAARVVRRSSAGFRPGRAPARPSARRNAVAHTRLLTLLAAWAWPPARRPAASACSERSAPRCSSPASSSTRTRAAWLLLPIAFRSGCGSRRSAGARSCRRLARSALASRARCRRALQWSTTSPYRDTAARLVDASSGSGAGRLVQYRATLELVAAHPLLGVASARWCSSRDREVTFRFTGWLHIGGPHSEQRVRGHQLERGAILNRRPAPLPELSVHEPRGRVAVWTGRRPLQRRRSATPAMASADTSEARHERRAGAAARATARPRRRWAAGSHAARCA